MTTKKEEQLYSDRLEKLENLKKAGVNPYPPDSSRTHTVAEVLSNFDTLADQGAVILTGRLRALRGHGKLLFGNLEDESAIIQIALKADVLGEQFDFFSSTVDVGDILQLSGNLFLTKKGERTLQVSTFKVLSKSLRALPEKFHGLKDTEARLRKRYLDMLANPETREMFRKKNVFWSTVRNAMVEEGFLEVQTPVLESIPGGADAEPFITHHNALDRDFFLRISLELPLKRLLVGGFEKVFEIGRLFRNEGVDRDHLQEYDDIEFYWAYAEVDKVMDFLKGLYAKIATNVLGGSVSEYEGNKLDWEGQWQKLDYFELFKKATDIDLNGDVTVEMLRKKADQQGIKYDPSYGVGRMIDTIYKKTIRPNLIQPSFLVNHPTILSPLAKLNPKNPKQVLRFQVVAAATELGNGYSELNDPIDQKARFEAQMKLRAGGDKEAQMMDEDFVEALEYGMPPAVGFGMSERLFAILMDRSIRETVIFPPMRESE